MYLLQVHSVPFPVCSPHRALLPLSTASFRAYASLRGGGRSSDLVQQPQPLVKRLYSEQESQKASSEHKSNSKVGGEAASGEAIQFLSLRI